MLTAVVRALALLAGRGWRVARVPGAVRGMLVVVAALASPALAQRTVPVQLTDAAGAAADLFGTSVAIDGDTLVVGAQQDDVGANTNQGSAHVYRWTGSSWVFEATLTAADGSASDVFGVSVAIYGDTIVVGASLDDRGANGNQGSAYVFVRSGTVWTQQASLVAPDGVASDTFGTAVAIDADTIVVTSPGDDIGAVANQGSAYVFTRVGTTWTQQAKVVASDGASGDFFGTSVAISRDSVIIGDDADDVGANTNQGSACVFVRSGSTWTQQAKVTASDGAANDAFGHAVDISGESVIVGAYNDDVGANSNQGSAYVFVRSGATWTQQAQLIDSAGGASNLLGASVAMDGDSAMVGGNGDAVGANSNQGSVIAYARSGTSWTAKAQIFAPDGGQGDLFGTSVAISGDCAVVGAQGDTVGGASSRGSAWAFSRTGGVWIMPQTTMSASASPLVQRFGGTAAMTDDIAVIGARSAQINGLSQHGTAYILSRTGAIWSHQAQLIPAGGGTSDQFGGAVDVSGETVAVAASNHTVAGLTFAGTVYVYVRSGTTWSLQAQIAPADVSQTMGFGSDIALSGDTLAIGASGADIGANTNQGAIYVYTRTGTTWTQQAKLTLAGGAMNEGLGGAVALSGDTLIGGAPSANTNEGLAVVFTRSGSTWTQRAVLRAPDTAINERFASDVAISGSSVLIGAPIHGHNGVSRCGSAYVFTGSGSAWTLQSELLAYQPTENDSFGTSVTLDGDIAIIGAPFATDGAVEQGSVYVFERRGGVWSSKGRFTGPSPAAGNNFGSAVAMRGRSAVIGAPNVTNAFGPAQGAITFASIEPGDAPFARNISRGTAGASLDAEMAAAQAGDVLVATAACFRDDPTISMTVQAMRVSVDEPVHTQPGSTLTLGGGATLRAEGESVDLFGTLDVPASQWGTIACGAMRSGSRGTVHLFSSSQLVVDALSTQLDGITQLDSRASLSLRGSGRNCGTVTSGAYSDVNAAGTLINQGTWGVGNGSIGALIFTNRDAFNVGGTSAIFGDFVNDAGATTTITSGRLLVVGSLTNNGVIIGATCANCLGSAPNMDVGGQLVLGAGASLAMAFPDSTVHLRGSFTSAIDSNERFDLAQATVQFEGPGAAAQVTFEVMSTDIGPDVLGLDRSLAGHYPIGVLEIGPVISNVRLVDAYDNDGLGQGACEAIYVDELVIHAGSRLINPSCKIYYNTLTNDGTVDVPANVVQIGGSACPADFDLDGGITGADVGAFFAAYEGGAPEADLDQDGGITGGDIATFFEHFEAGC